LFESHILLFDECESIILEWKKKKRKTEEEERKLSPEVHL
jgi:hypothetical protein